MNLSLACASAFRGGKITLAVIIVGICLITLPASVRTKGKPGPAQQTEKVVLKHAAPGNEPIEIIDPSVDEKAIKLGEGLKLNLTGSGL